MLLSVDPENHNEIWLRWVDSAGCVHQVLAMVLSADDTEAVLSTSTAFEQDAQVAVSVRDISVTAKVVACRADQENFIVIIQSLPCVHLPESDRDPGVMAVDAFLSEEQENLLLEEMEREWRSSDHAVRASAN